MRIKRNTVLRFAIGIALLALVIYYSNLPDLWSIIVGVSIPWLIVGVLIHIIATGATALRLAFLSDRLDLFFPIFKANLGGMLLGDVTPGRAGYFATPLIVNKNCPELRRGRVLNVLFFGQIFDFLLRAVLLTAAVFTIFYALNVSRNLYLYGFLSLALVVALAVGFAMLAYGKIPSFLMWFIDKIPPISRLFRRYIEYTETASYTPKKAGGAFLITIVGWLLTALRWITVGHALGLD
ncbi:MAG: lysylphosphatidylglycerol synthase domain-containing protein, partial [Candidatus Thorarchaeota archaeon]